MNPDPGELRVLVASAREGSEDAARTLVEHFQPRVLGLVRLHLPRGEDPADIAQDVFVKVFTRLGRCRDVSSLWSWIAQITVRTCIDKGRAQKRRPLIRWSDLSERQQATLEDWHTSSCELEERHVDARDVIEQLLSQLSAQERLLIRSLDLEEQTAAEVAALTGWSVGNVRVKAYRARRRLKTIYRKLEKSKLC